MKSIKIKFIADIIDTDMKSIKLKFIVGIIAILIVAMFSLSVVFIKQSENFLIESIKNKAELLNRNFSIVSARDIEDNSFTNLQSLINEAVKKDREIKVMVLVNLKGIIIASSDEVIFKRFTRANKEEITRQIEKKENIIFINNDKRLFESIHFIFSYSDDPDTTDKTSEERTPLGIIYIALDTTYLQNSILTLWSYSIMITCVLMGISIIVAYFFGSSMSEPIKSLAEQVRTIASGNLENSIDTKRKDEIGQLISDVEKMRNSIRESNEMLRKSERKYRNIFENAVEGIFQTTPDGHLINVNPALAAIMGYDSPEDMLLSITDISRQVYMNPDDRKTFISLNEKGKVIGFETQMYRKDKTPIWVSMCSIAVRDENNNILYFEGSLIDIDKRKQGEALEKEYKARLEKDVEERTRELSETLENLKAAQNELIQSEKMAALGQLIAGIAHEINTPLGAIRASVDNIGSSLHEFPEQLPRLFQILCEESQKDFFALIQKASQSDTVLSSKEERKLKRALTGVLEENGLPDADTVADTLTDIGIYDSPEKFLPLLKHSESPFVLHTAYNLSRLRKSAKNIATAAERASKVVFALKSYARFDHSGEMIQADIADGIETVLTLYQNQMKHGIDVVRCFEKIPPVFCYPDELNQVWTNLIHNAIQAMDGKGILEIALFQKDNYAVITFTDSGKGIPDEIKDKIFQAFFTTKAAGEGSGLGLHIVKKIIDKHKGKIEIESRLGKTVFSVMIPTS
jgi:PAS domain S-box-containing protein